MTPFGTDEAVSRAVEAYSLMLLRLASARLDCAADAEDAVQEVFLKLLTARPSFRDAGHEKAWLIRTTLHRASDLRRSAARRNVPLEEAALAAAPEEDRSLLSAVRALPEKYGAVIHLYYYEGRRGGGVPGRGRRHPGVRPHGGDVPIFDLPRGVIRIPF